VNAAATNGTGYNALTGGGQRSHCIVAWLLQMARPELPLRSRLLALLTAAANGHLGIVSILLASGADLHAKTNEGKTALSFALERGHAEVTELLRQPRGLRKREARKMSVPSKVRS